MKKAFAVAVPLIGALIAVAAVVVYFVLTHAITEGIKNIKVLSKDTDAFKGFLSNEGPINDTNIATWMSFNFFNLTNHEAVLKAGAVPVYQKVGPYVFREFTVREANFTGNDTQVIYYQQKYYIYNQTASNHSLDPTKDRIYNVAPSYLAVLSQTKQTGSTGERGLLDTVATAVFPTLLSTVLHDFPMGFMVNLQPMFIGAVLETHFINDTGYANWANATVPPTPEWDDWIVSTTHPSNISMESAKQLFDTENKYSLTNGVLTDQAPSYWLDALTNTTTAEFLAVHFGLNEEQMEMVIAWLTHKVYENVGKKFAVELAQDQVDPDDVQEFEDIGYAQWGLCLTNALNETKGLPWQPVLPGAPEICHFFHEAAKFSTETTKTIFYGTSKPLSNSDNVIEFLRHYHDGQFDTIHTIWGLTKAQATYLGDYLKFDLGDIFGASGLTPVLFPATSDDRSGGLIQWRTPNEWLWEYHDPLLVLLQQNVTNSAVLLNQTSMAEVKKTTSPSIVYTGTDDISQAQVFAQWNGYTKLPVESFWAEPENVTGSIGNAFAADVSHDAELLLWDDTTFRCGHFISNETATIRDISVYRFKIAPKMFEPSAKFYQKIPGFANMTSTSQGAPVFLSLPNFYLVPGDWASKVKGLDTPDEKNDSLYIDVEPITGMTINEMKRLQINVYVNGTDLSEFHPQFPQNIFYPLFIGAEYQELNDYLASQFKDQLFKGMTVKAIILWAGLGVGVLLLIAGGFMVVYVSKKSEYEPI